MKGRKIYEKRKSRRGMCRKIFGEKKEEKKGKTASTNSWRKRNSRNEGGKEEEKSVKGIVGHLLGEKKEED